MELYPWLIEPKSGGEGLGDSLLLVDGGGDGHSVVGFRYDARADDIIPAKYTSPGALYGISMLLALMGVVV